MVFSIVLTVVFVVGFIVMCYGIGTSDRRIEKIETQRERDYLRHTFRG
jgi:hypothetical protein